MKKCNYCGKYLPENKAEEKALKKKAAYYLAKNIGIMVEMTTCDSCQSIIQMHDNLNFKDD